MDAGAVQEDKGERRSPQLPPHCSTSPCWSVGIPTVRSYIRTHIYIYSTSISYIQCNILCVCILADICACWP